ncbi:hypothetical protein MMC28_004213 [Mycoblastus sanguinarius]|nr:hypothetical protein [Mycoblastus sanguinarius]
MQAEVPSWRHVVPDDGRWLSVEGPYRSYIAAWCELNPNLRVADSKNVWTPLRNGNARVAMLELEQGRQVRRKDFSFAAQLSAHLKLPYTKTTAERLSANRIYIMEGLAPDFIAALGEHFLIDPSFFMEQERTTLWGNSHQGSKQIPCLPSSMDPGTRFLLKYYEVRDFGTIGTPYQWCARTGRNISITRNTRPDVYDLVFEPIGIVYRKCSFWSQTYDDKGWVG